MTLEARPPTIAQLTAMSGPRNKLADLEEALSLLKSGEFVEARYGSFGNYTRSTIEAARRRGYRVELNCEECVGKIYAR